jgi:hypothetical protein
MTSPNPLPRLDVADFGPGLDHVAEVYHQGKVFAILHKDDPIRGLLPGLSVAAADPFTYVVIHGGQEVSRFENLQVGTHEIPASVVAALLRREYGQRLSGMEFRLCTCYGNMLRPGDTRTAAGLLAALLPQARFEAYHGLVFVDANPVQIRRGHALLWDPTGPCPGPVVVGPPGPWEPVIP